MLFAIAHDFKSPRESIEFLCDITPEVARTKGNGWHLMAVTQLPHRAAESDHWTHKPGAELDRVHDEHGKQQQRNDEEGNHLRHNSGSLQVPMIPKQAVDDTDQRADNEKQRPVGKDSTDDCPLHGPVNE